MRKFNVLLSTLLLATLLLAACAGQETSTSVPATEEPQMSPEVTETSETPSMAETESPEETTTPVIPVTGGDDPARLSNQLDYSI